MNTTKGQTMTPEERLADMRARAATTGPVDWNARRRALTVPVEDRTDEDWALADLAH